MEKRKLMALASSAAMVMASMGIAPAVMADEVEKPEKITVMFDGTVFTQENGQAEFEARWEELTGIDLQIISQTIHSTMMYQVRPSQAAIGRMLICQVLHTTLATQQSAFFGI